jgi:hypothetical protein
MNMELRGLSTREPKIDNAFPGKASPIDMEFGEAACPDDRAFDEAFYQEIISGVANREVSVDEAVELG